MKLSVTNIQAASCCQAARAERAGTCRSCSDLSSKPQREKEEPPLQFGLKPKPARCRMGAEGNALLDGSTEPKPPPEGSWCAAGERPTRRTWGCKPLCPPPDGCSLLKIKAPALPPAAVLAWHWHLRIHRLSCVRAHPTAPQIAFPPPVAAAQRVFFLQAVVQILHFPVRKTLPITSYSPGI